MAFSIASITGLLRRNKKVQDPFGGDDEDFFDEDVFDDDSEGRSLGSKIALGVSGLLALSLIGFIATALFTADETAGPVTGMIPTEIAQIVSEDGEVITTLGGNEESADNTDTASAASGPIALPPLTDMSNEIVGDTTVETDRSAARRPWLNGGAGSTAAPGQPTGRATSMNDLLNRSRQTAPASPVASTSRDPEPGLDSMPELAEDEMLDEADMESAETQLEEEITPARPTLAAPGLVPGAPRRFAQALDANAGPATAGGAPRLTEPELPPTDSRAISAAPPRFATLPPAEQLVQDPNARARVAIIIEGLGLNRTATEAAIDSLPSAITLAFSPYTRDLQDWLKKASDAGHEVLVEVPMESKRFPADDPGPLGLLMSLDQIANVERLDEILTQADGSAGILNVTGSRFRESSEHINLVMNNLDARGMFYVQGRPGLRLGNDRVANATADIVIDEQGFRASIDARLDYIERLAKYQGSSVAVASAKPVTFERIALWLDEVGRRGVAVAPVSQVLIQ
jgi:uncharacterized protein